MKKLLLLTLITVNVFASTSSLDSVKKMNWGNVEVVWIEDEKFPRFSASILFDRGALSDQYSGQSQAMFNQLTSGTDRESQKELSDFFDFYGASLKHTVVHEYSVFTVDALTRDIGPVLGKVCEVFKNAQFPEAELKSYVSRSKGNLKNLLTSHSSLADRIFRQVSLRETPYGVPVEGTLASLDKVTTKSLKERLFDFNNSRKTIYLFGSKKVLEIESILKKDCPWTSLQKEAQVAINRSKPSSVIYLVPVPEANQAQIRIGRYLTREEFENKYTQYQFLAGFLGGGFTSKLVQELRVKRGLTYSASAYVSMQKDYGRAGVMTFSKNETAAETISLIKDIFNDVSNGKTEVKEFKHEQGHQIGGYAFGFEESSAFLSQLMFYDLQHRSYNDLVNYPAQISKLKPKDLAQASLAVFPWEKQTIVVIGDKSLEKSLSRIRPVEILNYQDFL